MKELGCCFFPFSSLSFFFFFTGNFQFGNWSLVVASLWVSCLIKGLPSLNINQLYLKKLETRDV